MQTKLAYYLAMAHAANITPRHIYQWLSIYPDIQSIYTAPEDAWRGLGITAVQMNALRHPDWAAVDKSLMWMQAEGCHILTLADRDYPQLLKEISDPPLVLFVRGDVTLLSSSQIAMVGARDVSVYGEKNAQAFAAALSKAGFVITSGLARGVDGASHRGVLAAGGKTIAVMGTGLNYIYPSSHRQLAADIVETGGALVSEFPLAAPPHAYHFPRRNRIISGLSKGVLVVEAALRSGSLVTARHAVEQGRDVYAIPGSIQSPVARGCHALIRQGAKLVEGPEDILEEIGGSYSPIQVEFSPSLAIIPESLSIDEQNIYKQVGSAVTPLDEIILRSGLTAGAVSSILLSLELKSYIQSVTGGYKRTS
jgi:DNA processing protein